MKKIQSPRGFTLLEILLVVAAIGILAGIVIVALNPAKQLGDTRNAQRHSDVATILNAVFQYSIDNNGAVPASIPTGTCSATTGEICATGAASCTGLADLGVLTTNQKYLTAIPQDPQGGTDADGAGYSIVKNATTNRITVCAPKAESGASITVTR